MRKELAAAVLSVDYAVLADPETLTPVEPIDRPMIALVAARVGTTRLIDNEPLGP